MVGNCILTLRWLSTLIKVSSHRSEHMNSYNSVFRENRCPPHHKPFYGGNLNHDLVTMKIRSKSQKPNQRFIMSHANPVKLCQLVHDNEISCTQETVTPVPAGSVPKTICSSPLHHGGHNNIAYSCLIKKTTFFSFMLSMKWSNINL